MKATKIILAVCLMAVAMTAGAQTPWVHITNTDGSKTNTSKSQISSMIIDSKPYSAHDYVEIGGIMWATMNLGATTVAESAATCYGDYYAWGEIEPYGSVSDAVKEAGSGAITTWSSARWGTTTGNTPAYNWNYYCNSDGFTEWLPAPYDADSKVLTSAYDAATANWGFPWRTPTKDDFVALHKACTGSASASTPTTISANQNITSGGAYWLNTKGLTIDGTTYGVTGILYVDKTDTSKRVFFPASYYTSGTNLGTASYFDYWSSSLYSNDGNYRGYAMRINSEGKLNPASNGNRYYGFAVRPVSNALSPWVHITKTDGTRVDRSKSDIAGMTIDTNEPLFEPCALQFCSSSKYQFIDLGTGDGVKWGNKNIGATTNIDETVRSTTMTINGTEVTDASTNMKNCYGYYFKWSETAEPTSACNKAGLPTLNSCDNPTLCSTHDAATVNCSGSRTPTQTEYSNLSTKCYWVWCDGIAPDATSEAAGTHHRQHHGSTPGWIVFKVKNNATTGTAGTKCIETNAMDAAYTLADTHIFLPAAGNVSESQFKNYGEQGNYWSSSLYSDTGQTSYYLTFSKGAVTLGTYSRHYSGLTVRPVSE